MCACVPYSSVLSILYIIISISDSDKLLEIKLHYSMNEERKKNNAVIKQNGALLCVRFLRSAIRVSHVIDLFQCSSGINLFLLLRLRVSARMYRGQEVKLCSFGLLSKQRPSKQRCSKQRF